MPKIRAAPTAMKTQDGHDFDQREPVFDFAEAAHMHRVERNQSDAETETTQIHCGTSGNQKEK